jgi:hypothetical protein
MSRGKYDLISSNMPYEQVVTIVGGPGTLVSQRTQQPNTFCVPSPPFPCSPPSYDTIQDYRWLIDNGGQAIITFRNGRVSAKTASGF